jgi:hypothetical protein
MADQQGLSTVLSLPFPAVYAMVVLQDVNGGLKGQRLGG